MRFNEFTSHTVTEGYLDNPGAEDSPVAQAIIRRILLQRTDLLGKYGPERVGAAVDEVADFVGDVEEIGSSDVSGWIRHVEQMLGNMDQGVAEGKETPESEVERLKLRQNAEHGKASLKRQAATQARIRELEKQIKDKSDVAEGVDIQYHQTSGTKAGHTISSRKLSNKPQASKSDVTLQSGSMHHRGKSYNFPKGTLFTQLPGGIFAKHPSVPETHPGFGHLIRRSEDNIHAIHNALNGEQGVAEAGQWSKMDAYQRDYAHSVAGMSGQRQREDDEHHEIDRRREEQLAQYATSGKFWLKFKDSGKHVSDQHYIGKAAAVAAAHEMMRNNPEVKGNLLLTAYGPNGE